MAGASSEIAEKATSADRLKLMLVGGSSLIPTILAYWGGGFAARSFMPDSAFIVWVFIAPICAMFILAIELVLNASMSPGGGVRIKWISVVPRVGFSILLGLTLAIPLKLAIFSGPIEAELNHLIDLKVRKIKSEDNKEIKLSTERQLDLVQQLDVKRQECASLNTKKLNELDGSEGTRVIGYGRVAGEIDGELKHCRNTLKALELEERALFNEIAFLRNEQWTERTKEIAELKSNTPRDLMARLGAWSSLAARNRTLYAAGVLIFLLLTCLDTIPTAIKATTRFDTYEMVEKLEKERIAVDLESEENARPALVNEKMKVLVDQAEKKRELAMLKNSLLLVSETLSLGYRAKEDLESRSIYFGIHDRVDIGVYQKIVDDMNKILSLNDEVASRIDLNQPAQDRMDTPNEKFTEVTDHPGKRAKYSDVFSRAPEDRPPQKKNYELDKII